MNELALLIFFPFLGGLFCYAIGKKNEVARDYTADLIAIVEFIFCLFFFAHYYNEIGKTSLLDCYIPEICGFGLSFTLDGFRLIYALIATFMWMMTTILSREYFTHHKNRNRFYLFFLLTLGATLGVFLSADLFTTFIFFEIMSFTSYVWVAQEENEASLQAAATYLAVAVIGGLVMLFGIFLLYQELGTLTISKLQSAAKNCNNPNLLYAAGACLLFGFGAKAGAFPLHIWLPKAHPVAPAPASALLSGILTKTGVFGILIISSNLFLHDTSWGSLILGIGVLTMFGGALLALFSVDLKRTLACSSMSQIGFILVGIGMQGLLREENALAVHGAFLHMVNHSLIKLVLFMAAGVIFMNTHALNLNEIRGFGRKKPLLLIIFLIGALAIGGIPGFGGYISKTLIHESIVEYGGGTVMKAIEAIFLLSGGLTIAYMSKLFVAIFIEKNEDEGRQTQFDQMKHYMNVESGFALTASALVLLTWGLFPTAVMDKAATLAQNFMKLNHFGETVHYFSLTNLSGAFISIGIALVVYALIVRISLRKPSTISSNNYSYINAWPKWLDLENLIYRPILLHFLPFILGIICRILDSAVDICVVILRKNLYKDSPLPYERPEGNAATAFLGHILNLGQKLKNLTWGRENPTHRDYVHLMAVYYQEIKESNVIIQRSLSFGLLLFGIGLSLTLIYIILM